MGSLRFIGIDSSVPFGRSKDYTYRLIGEWVTGPTNKQEFKIIKIDIPGQRKEVVLDIE